MLCRHVVGRGPIRRGLTGLAATLVVAGCAAPAAETPEGDKVLESTIEKLRQTDLNDFLSRGTNWAADEINDFLRLEVGIFTFAPNFGATTVFALPEVADEDQTVENIEDLVSGLSSRYGNNSLTTEVNALRRDFLVAPNGFDHYGETEFSFTVTPETNWKIDWSLVTRQLERRKYAGFDLGAHLNAHVIAPFESERAALFQGNSLRYLADSLKHSSCEDKADRIGLGFIIPECYEQYRDMYPGQMYSLAGEGRSGLFLTRSIPALIEANVIPGINYNLWLTTSVKIDLDVRRLQVQAVRLGGDQQPGGIPDEVVLDVSYAAAEIDSIQTRIEDRWQVNDLAGEAFGLELTGNIEEKASDLLDRTFERLFNRRLQLLKGRAGFRNVDEARLTLSRVRFDLDQRYAEGPWCVTDRGNFNCRRTDALATALNHMTHGDAETAMLLGNMGHPGIKIEFDLSRAGEEDGWEVGLESPVLGMEFYREHQTREVEVVLQENDKVRAFAANYLRDSAGAFFWGHDYARVGIAGQTYSFGEAEPESDAYFLVDIADRSGSMSRDRLLDHLDGILLTIAGPEAHGQLSAAGRGIHEEMRRLVERTCTDQFNQSFEACASSVIQCASTAPNRRNAEETANRIWEQYYYSEPEHRQVQEMCASIQTGVSRALANFTTAQPFAEMADGNAAERKTHETGVLAARRLLSAYTVYEEGPFSSDSMQARVDLRLNDAALSYLARNVTGAQFRTAVENYIRTAGASRRNPGDVVSESASVLRDLEHDWEDFRSDFRRYEREEGVDVAGLGVIGDRGYAIQVYDRSTNRDEDGSDADVGPYSGILLESFAQRRARVMTDRWDDMMVRVRGSILGQYFRGDDGLSAYQVRPDHVLTYSIASLLPSEVRDLRIDIRQSDVTFLGQPTRDYYDAAGYGPLKQYLRGPATTELFDTGAFGLNALIYTNFN